MTSQNAKISQYDILYLNPSPPNFHPPSPASPYSSLPHPSIHPLSHQKSHQIYSSHSSSRLLRLTPVLKFRRRADKNEVATSFADGEKEETRADDEKLLSRNYASPRHLQLELYQSKHHIRSSHSYSAKRLIYTRNLRLRTSAQNTAH